jgi:hypothetical protein
MTTLLAVVGISFLLATVTGDDDMAILQSNPSVCARSEIGVTAIAGVTDELPGECQPITLGDAAGPPDVPATALVVASGRGFAGEFVETVDAFGRNAHEWA